MFTQEEVLQAALAAARRGWRVFPVVASSDKTTGKTSWKKPSETRWPQTSTTDPDTIHAWWERYKNIKGYGWHTAGFVAIDFDREDGEKLLNDHDLETPPTLIVRSGNTNEPWHSTLVYKLPPGRRLKITALSNFKKLKHHELFTKIDIRSSGGMIVGPGSNHATGGVYSWNEIDAAPAPAWLLALSEAEKPVYTSVLPPVTRAQGKRKEGPRTAYETDLSREDYLMGVVHGKFPITGIGQRHIQTRDTIAYFFSQGLSRDEVLPLARRWLAKYEGIYGSSPESANADLSAIVGTTVHAITSGSFQIPAKPEDHRQATAEQELLPELQDQLASIQQILISAIIPPSPTSRAGRKKQVCTTAEHEQHTCSVRPSVLYSLRLELAFLRSLFLHWQYEGCKDRFEMTDRQLLAVYRRVAGRELSLTALYAMKSKYFRQTATILPLVEMVTVGTLGESSVYRNLGIGAMRWDTDAVLGEWWAFEELDDNCEYGDYGEEYEFDLPGG